MLEDSHVYATEHSVLADTGYQIGLRYKQGCRRQAKLVVDGLSVRYDYVLEIARHHDKWLGWVADTPGHSLD